MSDCDCAALRQELQCVKDDVEKLWDEVFGTQGRVFVFTGNTGVPTNNNPSELPEWIAQDQRDYALASMLINGLNPAGIFLTGRGNYDWLVDGFNYFLYWQEGKVYSGFAEQLARGTLYPVMGDHDYFPAVSGAFFSPIPPGSGAELEQNKTWLRMFPYLSDAKRYYSVYDDKSDTEFFVLSSGRTADAGGTDPNGFWTYAQLDSVIGEEQHTWFMARASSSTAGNKIVIFHHPFVAVPNSFNGVDGVGIDHVWNDFKDWDFESVGVRLIINGHSGYGAHFRRGSMHIVNASSFVRSKLSPTRVGTAVPRPAPPPIGATGWALEYYSVANPNLETIEGVLYPGGFGEDEYMVPKTEFVKVIASNSGVTVEIWSYNLALATTGDIVNSLKLEHSFEISAID